MAKLKEADWIALRLLYIVLAADPSAGSLPDVAKTIQYYEKKLRPKGSKNKYSTGSLLPLFALLNKEIANDGETFNNPEVQLTRRMDVEWRRDEPAGDGVTIIKEGMWKSYGINPREQSQDQTEKDAR